MAIDTVNEKLALIEYSEPYQVGIPVSSDGLDQADKQQLLWEYPGFLWIEGWTEEACDTSILKIAGIGDSQMEISRAGNSRMKIRGDKLSKIGNE